MLWLVIEGVCNNLHKKRITLFSDNLPTIGWVMRLASKKSSIAINLIQALALRLKTQHACPLTPMHIEGKQNAISDVLSRSFGSNPKWMCKSDDDLLTRFNSMFSLPMQKSWTVYRPNCAVVFSGDFNLADEAFRAGRLEATSKGRATHWQNWCTYVRPMGVDLYLQQAPFTKSVRCLTGFAARTRTGYYGKGQQVQSSTVTSAITAIGQTISLACNNNPTKIAGSVLSRL